MAFATFLRLSFCPFFLRRFERRSRFIVVVGRWSAIAYHVADQHGCDLRDT